ncbi:TRAP transporter substrate-binding protein [Lutibaculum baratangense]|uniref:TRAP-type C4-dicarboxylate transport system, periplasmic component n=1 Tax=Lutibaculum baratangense AMV1 TaxID=631454 RepID=V4REB3_9HYPH|nr:TRAP transporter substrate-binding protein [Lutibaculum baratangense]ESR23734.1 TRAP-type C4-dicarboxylate transport system, periplasmic component [Lutibaculum baratangense AMV1]
MKTSKWLNLTAAAAIAAAAGLAGVGGAAAQTPVIMSNDNNAVGVKGKTFELLKEEIEKRLGDAVAVELHHSGALFDQNTQIQGLQLGSAHIIAPTSGHYATIAPNVNALSLPFLLSTPDQIQEAMEDPTIRAAIFEDMEAKNVTPVAIWMNGPRDLGYTGSKAIVTPEDMAGVKIRVQSIPIDIAAFEAVNAHVVAMSWSEVPTAMQQGVLDAVEPTPNALVGAGLDEMIDQLTKLHYYYSFYIVGANKQWWDGLSEEVRQGIQEALDVATEWNWENTRIENDEAYAKVEELGKTIHEVSEEDREKWVAAMQPVWQRFGADAIGEEAMNALRRIGGVEQ